MKDLFALQGQKSNLSFVSNYGEQTSKDYEGILQVQTVYKGALPSDKVAVKYFLPDELFDTMFVPLKTGSSCLYFLNRTGDNITLYYPGRPCFPLLDKRPQVSKDYSLEEAVKAELIQNIEEGEQNLALQSLSVLGNDKAAMQVAKSIAKGNKPLMVKAAAIAYLLRNKDAEALTNAIEIVEQLQEQPNSQAVVLIAQALPAVAKEVSPEQAQKLFAANDVNMHSALGLVILENSTPDFASFAVNMLEASKSQDAQYDALVVISRLRRLDVPSIDSFIQDPKKYVAEYSSWWKKEGKDKYSRLK